MELISEQLFSTQKFNKVVSTYINILKILSHYLHYQVNKKYSNYPLTLRFLWGNDDYKSYQTIHLSHIKRNLDFY